MASHPVGAPAVRGFRSRTRISLKKSHLPEPVSKVLPSRADHQEIDISTSFESLGLLPELLRAVAEHGYTEPTPIQAQAIPVVLSGRDLLGAAQTGTGKTAGFTLPLLQRLAPMATKSFSPALHPVRCLILTPTRELAIQVHESVQTYGKHVPLRSFCVYGGVNINPQIEALKKGVEILVATPGRLLDLIQQKALTLRTVQILVLDEADRMLDMGFIPDIKRIIGMLPPPPARQTLLFSATFSDEIRKLAAQFQKDPATVEVARRNTPAELVTQYCYHVDSTRKRELLAHLVKKNNWEQVLVFCKTKHGSNRLATQLQKDGINADAIHGNKSQNARVRALEDFKEGKVKVLVATDIAARGIDIIELPHVVNFDLPHVPEDYVHRIGRTGRAGSTGEAFSLVGAEDRPLLGPIERLINRKIEVREADGFDGGRARSSQPAREAGAEPRRERSHSEPKRERSDNGPKRERSESPKQPRSEAAKQPRGEQAKAPRGEGSRRTQGARDGERGRNGSGQRSQPSERGSSSRSSTRDYSSATNAPRGNSGGMDFNKPYEPSAEVAAAPSEETSSRRGGKTEAQVPALFKRRAA